MTSPALPVWYGMHELLAGELLCEAVDVHPGERVLDVADGIAVVGRAAARRFADVTRAPVSSVTALPYADATFDTVVSAFGAMYAVDSHEAAEELARVCRPGGRLGLCSWLPDSLVGAAHVVAGQPVAARTWGVEDSVRALFGRRVSTLRFARRDVVFRYRSAAHMLDELRERDAVVQAALGVGEQDAQHRLAEALIDMFAAHNRADDGTLVASSEYLEIVAEVR